MNQNQTVFVIDAGNSFLKVGLFNEGKLENVHRIKFEDLDLLKSLLNTVGQKEVIISSVLSHAATQRIIEMCDSPKVFTNQSRLPISIKYETPNSLGFDRICNAVASQYLANKKNTVSIDIGTCIKFDFTDNEMVYHGGSISPGINLRYKSMNDYTGKLPLITDKTSDGLIGNSTSNSMRSGVMNGIQAEIEQFIQLYTEQYQDLTFFVTGGDALYFDFHSKNNIFVDENLTLLGLYQIYLFNA